MVYVLRDATDNILSYGETPYVLSGGQSEEELAASMSEIEALFVMTAVDSEVDLNTPATIEVSLSEQPANVTIRLDVYDATEALIDSTTELVALTAGEGSFTVQANAPCVIVATPDDKTLYAAAGRGTVFVVVKDLS